METKLIEINNTWVKVYEDGRILRLESKQKNRGKTLSTRPENFLKPSKKSNGYMQSSLNDNSIYIHRVVAEAFFGPCPTGCVVDHINNDRSDNHKNNLRYLTNGQNIARSSKPPRGASEYKGVTWHKRRRKWQVKITVEKKVYYGGYFADERDAAYKYNQMAKELGRPKESLNNL